MAADGLRACGPYSVDKIIQAKCSERKSEYKIMEASNKEFQIFITRWNKIRPRKEPISFDNEVIINPRYTT